MKAMKTGMPTNIKLDIMAKLNMLFVKYPPPNSQIKMQKHQGAANTKNMNLASLLFA